MAKEKKDQRKHREEADNPNNYDQSNAVPADEPYSKKRRKGVSGRGRDPDILERNFLDIETKTDLEASTPITRELDEDEVLDLLVKNPDEEAFEQTISTYTTDSNIVDEFSDRQNITAGSAELEDKLMDYTGLSPEISAEDLDADWEYANQSGEETVGGSSPTPDQDIVEEIGEAAGLTYKDDEPLNYAKVGERDEQRWELNPDYLSEIDDEEDMESLNAIEEEEDELDDDEYRDASALLAGEDSAEDDEEDIEEGEFEDEEADDDDDLAEDVAEFGLIDLEDDEDEEGL